MEFQIVNPSECLSTKLTRGKIITCKAAVAWTPGTSLTIEDVEVECPQKMEIRVKILYTSICHTDLTSWLGENEAQQAYPRIFGHEASGVIESVGEGVEDLKEGDHVIPVFHGECGSCAYCQSDKTNQCEKYRVNPMKSTMFGDGKTRFSIKGVGAVWNDANVKEGETIAVFGLGAIGLAVIQGARIRHAARIIGIDINRDKIEIGREMGMTDFVNPKELDKPVHEVINGMVKGGVDYSFECVGNLDVLRQAFLSTRDGWGVTVMIGIHTSPRLLPFHPMELFNGRRIVGSVFGGIKCKTHIPSIVKKYIDGTLKLDAFITHELPFDEINQAFKLLEEGKSLRCLLHF
ncbi:Alcohol dehydrogenase 2, putative, expressed [Zostera marina]|uniref:Alcohol dehydrogenase 2, putative, expressed n=1 Tax=Zostera marina TaxID=29655 RepID=A0A0K9PYD3_ZOSMR|nr:Alcohol dehydrogenase 2, putative, expressed [Zostera marina]